MGTQFRLLAAVGFTAACVTASIPQQTDSGVPAQQAVDSGVQEPPRGSDAGGTVDAGGIADAGGTVDAGGASDAGGIGALP